MLLATFSFILTEPKHDPKSPKDAHTLFEKATIFWSQLKLVVFHKQTHADSVPENLLGEAQVTETLLPTKPHLYCLKWAQYIKDNNEARGMGEKISIWRKREKSIKFLCCISQALTSGVCCKLYKDLQENVKARIFASKYNDTHIGMKY